MGSTISQILPTLCNEDVGEVKVGGSYKFLRDFKYCMAIVEPT